MDAEFLAVDLIAELLVRHGVRHVFGVGGANIEDLFAAVQRRRPEMKAVLGKHEHAAGTAADAYARVSGRLGVVMTTSGGGAMNLVSALAEARASRVPVLALVGEPPTDVQGLGAFQDTSGRGGAIDAAQVFGAVAVWCARAERADQLPELVEKAIAAAHAGPGPAVLLIAKDRQREAVPRPSPAAARAERGRPPTAIDRAQVARAAELLRGAPVLVIAGTAVASPGARTDLARLAAVLDARVAVAPDGRAAFDNRDPRFAGVAGAMGHAAVASALAEAGVCLLVGTRMPLLARQGLEARLRETSLVSLGEEAPFVTSQGPSLHLSGDASALLAALLEEVSARVGAAPPPASRSTGGAPLPAATPGPTLDSPGALALVSASLPDGGVVLVDAGNTGAQVVHHLRAPRGGHWLLAMGMAGMGYTFGAAVGAALASGERCTVLAGDGAFFMHGLDIHTAVEHALPITYLIFNNRAHGMCLVRERLLVGQESGYNTFRPSHIGAGLAAMFPGLLASDCTTPAALKQALARAATAPGPAVIGVELAEVEIPPFSAFAAALRSAAAAPTLAPGRWS